MSTEPYGLTRPADEPVPAPGKLFERHTANVRFTGSGGEYFRIWIVNLLLTLVTLGIYSAWAKVRKAQYFRGNTQLGGHVFGYHGNPKAILRGRIVALALFTLYSWGFAFSKTSGLVTMAVLSAVGPWLFMRGLQFALTNTSFRGLRFGLRADPFEAYRRLLPVLALWWCPTVLTLTGIGLESVTWLVVPATLPWMHHRLKAYQHGRATYGNLDFAFEPATSAFYAVYAKGVGVLFIAGTATSLVFAAIFFTHADSNPYAAMTSMWAVGGIMLIFYLIVTPYYMARLQQIVWNHTRLGDLGFRMEIKASELYKLALKNTVLTLLSGGLYWPWASVALARYQLSCLEVHSGRSMAVLAVAVGAPEVSATGDGAVDAFGLDIGL